MRVAMIGQKGYPPVHGGIEKHVAEISERLTASGIKVDIYSRPHYSSARGPSSVDGLEILRIPSVPTKHLDAITHTIASTFHAMFRKYDIVHYHALGPGLLSGLPRLLPSTRTVVTVHGLDWQREKWGPLASSVLKIGERASVMLPDQTIVVSKALQTYYRQRYDRHTHYIPNGITEPGSGQVELLKGLGVTRKYILFVGRLVPEKGCHLLCEAYGRLPDDVRREYQLVIAGDAGFTEGYVRDLKSVSPPETLFTGYVQGDNLDSLYANADMVVLPSTLEGLSIALLEGMSHGRCCLVSDIPPNREAAADCAPFFRSGESDDLLQALIRLLADPAQRADFAQRARKHVLENYSWTETVQQTLKVYRDLAAG
jgi:glycosyltransferase involved in cell wall biosynthesis